MCVYLKERDIRYGKKKSKTHCPVALAIARAQGGGLVSVLASTILTTKGIFWIPENVWEWICIFDQGHSLGPFDFVLEKKEESEPLPLPDNLRRIW